MNEESPGQGADAVNESFGERRSSEIDACFTVGAGDGSRARPACGSSLAPNNFLPQKQRPRDRTDLSSGLSFWSKAKTFGSMAISLVCFLQSLSLNAQQGPVLRWAFTLT